MRESLASVLMLVAVAIMAAPAQSAATPAAVPFVTVAAGQRSGIMSPLQAVIRDPAAWSALWRRHVGIASASPPAVDFEKTMVIAVFAGRSPASTAVRITRIFAESERLAVYYIQGERRPQSEQGQEATPFYIVRLPRSERAVRFVLVKTPPVLAPGPSS